MKRIYLDHSATTPLDARVLDAMLPYFNEFYGNSLAVHSFGREAERAVESSRQTVASLLNAAPHEIVFTSGGTESDNLALRGLAQYAHTQNRPFTIVTTPVEHEAVIGTARQLCSTMNAALRLVPVDHFGQVWPDDLRAALRGLPAHGITLVSLIHTNNEVGTVNHIAALAAVAREYGALIHTDAVQGAGQIALDVQALDVDMLSMSAHKLYGPKGMGVFYLRDGVPFLSSSTGAKHEDYRRAGTHNVPGIVGTAQAVELARAELTSNTERLAALRNRLVEGVLTHIPDVELSGHPTERLSGHASFVFRHVESNVLLMHLDQHGIAASSGSACKTGNPKPSAILEALGYGSEWTRGGLRLTLGHSTTAGDVDVVLAVLLEAVERIRKIGVLSLS
ncbi:MAG TPA: cysteine desulfurase family protein [Aggregatilineaceae bacterium]|nr:cysteine desulfurase family protein [Aggregatilineaceae bacterium]